MSYAMYDRIKPYLSQIESLKKSREGQKPYQVFKEMSKDMERILPETIGYDIVLRAGGVIEHVFYDKNNPSNAILV